MVPLCTQMLKLLKSCAEVRCVSFHLVCRTQISGIDYTLSASRQENKGPRLTSLSLKKKAAFLAKSSKK